MKLQHDTNPTLENGQVGAVTVDSTGSKRALTARRAGALFGTWLWGIFLASLYLFLIVAPLTLVATFRPQVDHPFAAELGVDCALVGYTILSLQFVLTARLSWVEAPFGLDLLLVFHRVMALVAVALLVAHPLLVASAEGWSLLTGLRVAWYIWVGRAALTMLLLHVTISLARRAVRLSYERWRRLHNVVAVTILSAGFLHSVLAGDDFEGSAGRALWALVPVIGLTAWAYSRFVRPRLLERRPFHVVSIEPAAPRAWTLTLEAPAGRRFRFFPGQFQFLRFLGAGVPAEEHPFTIASSPQSAGRLSVTIKECGDFTGGLGRVRVGDRAVVHGPFGRFSYDLHPAERRFVFVAGGVGITPLMSMLRSMRDRGESRPVTLVYAARAVHDLLFTAELSAMAAGTCPSLEVIYVLSHPPVGWKGETGRVDADCLDLWCEGLDQSAFYICCPPAMTRNLIRGLTRRRVSPRRIHCDYFSL